MFDIENFLLLCENNGARKEYNTKVTLKDFIKECFMFVFGCVFIFWWYYPILKTGSFIYKKYFRWTENITHECKRRK